MTDRREIYVNLGLLWYVAQGAMFLMLAGILATAIVIAVCLCQYLHDIKHFVKEMHAAIVMLQQLAPCLENQFCQIV